METQQHYSDAALDGAKTMGFDDGYIDESLFHSWIMDTPMQSHMEADFSPSSSSASSSNGACFFYLSCLMRRMLIIQQIDFDFASTMSPRRSIASQPSRHLTGSNLLAELSRQPSSQSITGRPSQRSTPRSISVDEEPSSAASWSERRRTSETCPCLVSSISFLEKLVSKSAACEGRINTLLGEVRQSMDTMARFIECERCEARVEQSMLLAMATRQIGMLCKKLADSYREIKGRQASARVSSQKTDEAQSEDVSILGYRASQREKMYLVKGLVTLQLADFQRVISAVKARYRQRPDQAQVDALTEAEAQLELAHAVVNTLQ